MAELTSALIAGLPKTGATDPIEYYRRPLVGWLYRKRINIGLELLPNRRFARALEIGYGAGAVLLALASDVDQLSGIDLDADPAAVAPLLETRGKRVDLRKASVYELPYGEGTFDLVVSFSVFEHLSEYERALGEVARVLAPGGLFLLGMPSVNRMMEVGFRAIGFRGIEDHHVTTPRAVSRAFGAAGLRPLRRRGLDLPVRPLRVYHTWLLEKVTRT
jgi:SAM-dependent methyltransferase